VTDRRATERRLAELRAKRDLTEQEKREVETLLASLRSPAHTHSEKR
jgi:hypothetical protein